MECKHEIVLREYFRGTNVRVHSRWLRLLFTREFSLPDAMILWDGIFACDQTFELVPWICVAMLIRIRNRCEFLGLCECASSQIS